MDHDLHLPSSGDGATAAVVLHPHPAMGGDRHHPLVVAVCRALAASGAAALRVDLRDPDVSASSRRLEQIATDLRADTNATRLVLVGYSWGAAVAAITTPESLVARVLVAPPLTMVDPGIPAALRATPAPTLLLVPEHDQYSPPDAVRGVLGDAPSTTIEIVDGTDHFLGGAVAGIAIRASSWVAHTMR